METAVGNNLMPIIVALIGSQGLIVAALIAMAFRIGRMPSREEFNALHKEVTDNKAELKQDIADAKAELALPGKSRPAIHFAVDFPGSLPSQAGTPRWFPASGRAAAGRPAPPPRPALQGTGGRSAARPRRRPEGSSPVRRAGVPPASPSALPCRPCRQASRPLPERSAPRSR